MKDAYEFGRIATTLKSHESSRVAATNSTLKWKNLSEFVRAEYDDLEGTCVAAKKGLKALSERLNFLSAQVVEMAIEIDNLVQHNYSIGVKLVGVPNAAET